MRIDYELSKAWILGFVLIVSLPLTDIFGIPHVRATVFAGFALVFFLELLSGRRPTAVPFHLMAGIAFAVIMTFGLLYTRAPNYGYLKLTLFSSYFLVLGYLTLNWVTSVTQLRWFVAGVIAGGFIILVLFVIQFGSPLQMLGRVERFYRFRLGSTGDPISVARYLGVFAFFTIVLSLGTKSKFWKILGFSLGATSIAYMGLTGSKGPVLALFFAFVATGYYYSKNAWHAAIRISLGSIVFVGSIAMFVSIMPSEFVNQRIYQKLESLSNRMPGYVMTIDSIERASIGEMVAGHGTGDFGFYSNNSDSRAYPHNIFLESAYENGILGLIALVGALLGPIVVALRVRRFNRSDTDLRRVTAIMFGGYVFWLTNAQYTGDLGSNSYLGAFAALLISAAHLAKGRGESRESIKPSGALDAKLTARFVR